MKRKLGINSNCIKDRDQLKNLETIKETGFETFFSGADFVPELCKKAQELDLEYAFIHAPFKNINTMWLAGLDYREIMGQMKHSVDLAAEYGVPAVIAHVSSGWKAPEITELGLSRFDELVTYADDKNVIIAFENLRKTGNLAYLTDRYENCSNVKYCYDNGHEHCYTKTVSWPDIFCFDMKYTHIHDNHGRGWEKDCDPDEHLLPFDGTFDYENMMRRLDFYRYDGALMLEVFNSAAPEYLEMTPEQFIKTSYDRIKKISEM